jgi:hypothetical protein
MDTETLKPIVYTESQVSALIGVPKATLRWWRVRGHRSPPLKHFTLKGTRFVRYRASDVEAYLAASEGKRKK